MKNLKGSIILLITAVIWGTSFVAQSMGMDHIEPFTFNALRTLTGGLVLIPVLFDFRLFSKRSPEEAPKKAPLKTTILGGICCGFVLFIASSFQQAGIVTTTAGKSGFVTALYLIIVPIIALILGQKQKKKIWFCVVLAIAGFFLLCIKPEDFSVSQGDLLTLACAFFFAVHIMVIDRFNSKNVDGPLMACIQFFTAGTLMLIMMFLFEKPQLHLIWNARYSILYAGVMSCSIAYTLQIIGQRYTAPALATLIMSLESVFAVLSGCIILGESLSLREISGCVMVFAAVLIAQLELPLKNKKIEKREI
jgi:drug/metabolite transporter (DMT)-like permease